MKALKPTFEDKPLDPSNPAEGSKLFPMPADDHQGSATLFAGDELSKEDPGWQSNLVFGQTIGVDTAPDLGPRYEVLAEIAHGGMGVVFRGTDREMGRPIAIKVLREKHQGKPEMVNRFIEEAQVTGQLQHPGIVPVYEIGYLSGKLPYFTMRLIEGKTLEALMTECRSEPVLAEASHHRLLKIFGQVAQTVAYAHARGVIHRDLKPHNIMVGSFGEILVMDWGLAKVMAPSLGARLPVVEAAFTGSLKTIRSASCESVDPSVQTKVGSIIGTPAYMAPEQARGELAKTDCRADVFGLGAILCEILTGKPPFPGATGMESCDKACRGDLKDAYERLESCGADAGWIVLAHECLSVDPEFRPADAGHVAARVSAYFADLDARVKRAEQDRAKVEVEHSEAEKRRGQARLWSMAVVVLALMIAFGGIVWMHFLNQHRIELADYREKNAVAAAKVGHRQAEQRRAVEVALAQLAGYRDQSQFPQARATLEQAELLMDDVSGDSKELLARARRELDWAGQIDQVRVRRFVRFGDALDDGTVDAAYAEAFRRVGFGADEQPAAVVAARIRASGVPQFARDVLEEWFCLAQDPKRRTWLRQARRALGGGPAWEPLWDLLERRTSMGMVAAAAGGGGSPHLLMACGAFLDQEGHPDEAMAVMRLAHEQVPGDFWVNYRMGAMLCAKSPEDAIGFCRAAVAIRPDSPAAHNNLGFALAKTGRTTEGQAALLKAASLEIRAATAHRSLGDAFGDPAETRAAEFAYRKALAVAPDLAVAHSGLAAVLDELGRPEEAAKEYEKALGADPDRVETHAKLARLLLRQGRAHDAAALLGRAAARFPNSAEVHFLLGNAQGGMGRNAEAEACYRRAVACKERYAAAWINLSVVLSRLGDQVGAIRAYETGWAHGVAAEPGWTYGRGWDLGYRRLAEWDARLPEILAGSAAPADDWEAVTIAKSMCIRGHVEEGLALYNGHFQDVPADEDLEGGSLFHARYNAACLAVQAAGESVGADKAGARRALAAKWLRQCVETIARHIQRGGVPKDEAVAILGYWLRDPDLGPVRDPILLKALAADERAEWMAFWSSCAGMVK